MRETWTMMQNLSLLNKILIHNPIHATRFDTVYEHFCFHILTFVNVDVRIRGEGHSGQAIRLF